MRLELKTLHAHFSRSAYQVHVTCILAHTLISYSKRANSCTSNTNSDNINPIIKQY